ncbi:MAG: ABC transporter permease [Gemmatimonadetes bacterium]|nr:ABC transporter permease [Gemmatimonadota bacterium]
MIELLRSRGASTAQVLAAHAVEGLVAIAPGAVAAGIGVVLLVEGRTVAATVALAAGLALAAVAGALVGVLGTMAVRDVVRSLSRTAPAAASLVVAVSVTVGLGVMIDSFRSTVGRWLERTLQADVYVALPSTVATRAGGTLDPGLVERLVTAPGVEGASRYRNLPLPRQEGEARLLALDLHPRGEVAFAFAGGDAADAMRRFRAGEGVLVSEPFAFREGVGVGDTVRLATDRGQAALPVAGVFYDYGSDRGVVMMEWELYERLHADRGVTSLGLFLEPAADRDAVMDGLRARAAGAPQAVSIRSNRVLREASLEVFDRTFAITAVLRALAFVVAFIGVLGALMALQLERGRELGVLRATGLTPGQVWRLVTAQTGLLGLAAGLLSLPAGLALAWLMIHVVNRRSFGWTVTMELPPSVFLEAVALAVAGALLAGLYPAWRMARTSPAAGLREE